ncbi:MAG TPA: P-II family nitrogen regulator [Gammaproteobacteria bacterium]|nr:P-II family nitrogen regulator [Gammaproteobacteria bacterium]
MKYRKVTAIIRRDALEKVERKLQQIGVQGISVTRVKGYGEYADFYARDWMTSYARIEIFTTAEKVDGIAEAIMDAAHVGLSGDGIVAVLPVEKLYRIRTKSEATTEHI